MSKYIIDRDAASEFDDPAWLDDLWSTAIKKFGGKPVDEQSTNKADIDELLVITSNSKKLLDFATELSRHTHRTEGEWWQFIIDAIFKEIPSD